MGPMFLALLEAAAENSLPLSGMQHAVLGEAGSTADGDLAQNVPRLVDKYLGECGSRRFLRRSEVDAGADGRGASTSASCSCITFAQAAVASLECLPHHTSPAACKWTEAHSAHNEPTDRVREVAAGQLEDYRPSEDAGVLGIFEVCPSWVTYVVLPLWGLFLAVWLAERSKYAAPGLISTA